MGARPLLIFPLAVAVPRQKKHGGPSDVHYPTAARQRARLVPEFRRLQQTFEAYRALLLAAPIGIEPERVLVLETVGSVESFITAVKHTPGMEWLGEWDEENIPEDEDFFADERQDGTLSGRLYLVMSDQRAMDELVSLWTRYIRNQRVKLDRGLAKWRALFRQLRTVRFWDAEDRLDPHLVQLWRNQLDAGQPRLRFHAELWFKRDEQVRRRAAAAVAQLIQEAGGVVLGQTLIPEIAYHAIVGEIPRARGEEIVNDPRGQLILCDQVMFYRALGQSAVGVPQDGPAPAGPDRSGAPLPRGDAVIALFDGLPLENHELLTNRLTIDDPDNWSADYEAQNRVHGTAMASLIVHGELDGNGSPLTRPVYVRPILRPENPNWLTEPIETIPERTDPLDLVHRAVRRLFEREDDQPPVAPQIRIINFSICDRVRPFDRSVSPLARLLDYLAWRYKVLFVVSAGNHPSEIRLDVLRQNFRTLGEQQLEDATILALDRDAINRRILSPAEAINVLTIGAAQLDSAATEEFGHRINPLVSAGFPSPVSAIGPGFKRTVKPDVLFEGGRQLYTEKLGNAHRDATLFVDGTTTNAPGQRVATPGRAGNVTATRYMCGTSNATALASRAGSNLMDTLDAVRAEPGGHRLEDRFVAVTLKAMLAHGASWRGARDGLERILQLRLGQRSPREYLARFLGYGRAEASRLGSCTDQRATILGWGELLDNEGHQYRIPLPPSLSGRRIWRRLTVTLAWFTPIEPLNQKYKTAALWFDPAADGLHVNRIEVDARMTQRGTLQHEVLEGEDALAFLDGEVITVQVNCRAHAARVTEPVPYSVVVSLEVAPETEIPLYEEIRARLLVGVVIGPGQPN
jgi:hypothetical protein